MNFCCIAFEEACRRDKRSCPNIRIVRFVSDFLTTPKSEFNLGRGVVFKLKSIPRQGEFRFYVTAGYEKFHLDLPAFNIEYCPFCGVNLDEYYQSKEYANEVEGTTFTIK
jgi:hypothetical protein